MLRTEGQTCGAKRSKTPAAAPHAPAPARARHSRAATANLRAMVPDCRRNWKSVRTEGRVGVLRARRALRHAGAVPVAPGLTAGGWQKPLQCGMTAHGGLFMNRLLHLCAGRRGTGRRSLPGEGACCPHVSACKFAQPAGRSPAATWFLQLALHAIREKRDERTARGTDRGHGVHRIVAGMQGKGCDMCVGKMLTIHAFRLGPQAKRKAGVAGYRGEAGNETWKKGRSVENAAAGYGLLIGIRWAAGCGAGWPMEDAPTGKAGPAEKRQSAGVLRGRVRLRLVRGAGAAPPPAGRAAGGTPRRRERGPRLQTRKKGVGISPLARRQAGRGQSGSCWCGRAMGPSCRATGPSWLARGRSRPGAAQ